MGNVVLKETEAGFDAEYMKVYNAMLETKEADTIQAFTKTVRSGDGNGFETGDIITLPSEIKPLAIKINGSTNKAEGILVKVTRNGDVRYQVFYPSCLSKRTVVCEADAEGNAINKQPARKPDGDAAKWYQKKAGMKVMDVMKEMAALGKDIKVSFKKTVKTPVYNGVGVTDTNIYNFDFA